MGIILRFLVGLNLLFLLTLGGAYAGITLYEQWEGTREQLRWYESVVDQCRPRHLKHGRIR